MKACEIEDEIQCTVDQEETPLADLRDSVEPFLCACGQSFQHDERGVSALLKKCNICFAALRSDLGDHSFVNEIADTAENLGGVPCADDPDDESEVPINHDVDDDAAITDAPFECQNEIEPNAPLTEAFVAGAMTMAVSDSHNMFSIDLNGNKEIFTFVSDPVNSSAARKMFTRKSWKHPELYWYRVFGAMATGKNIWISPCVIKLKADGPAHVLCAILETMCYRPRFDGLVYSSATNTVSIIKNFGAAFKGIDMEMPFDNDVVERCILLH